MSSLDELERELGPLLRTAYHDHLPQWERDAAIGRLDVHRHQPRRRRSAAPVGIAAALVVLLASGLMWATQRHDGNSVATTLVTSTVSTTTPTNTRLERTLAVGSTGSDVEMVQQRLADLGFVVGPVDGVFGTLTTQAVWAYEKLLLNVPRDEATGTVTPAMWEQISRDAAIEPRRPTGGVHVEIYLPEQVMVVFRDDRPAAIAHVSTGALAEGATAFAPWPDASAEYCETVTIDSDDRGDLLSEPVKQARCGRSYTPPGDFEVERIVEGQRRGRLGTMWDPIYINQGIAIHGAPNVPLHPASRGTVKVSRAVSDVLPTLLRTGDEVLIWDGVTDPWNQPPEVEQMRFDYPDPNDTAVAVIDIPAIGIEGLFVVPLNEQDDLKNGPGWDPSSAPVGSGGTTHIIGHRTTYGAPFFDLDLLVVGDVIEVRTRSGQNDIYTVQSRTVVANDTPLPELEHPALVLDTLTPKYTQRSTLRVTAVLAPLGTDDD